MVGTGRADHPERRPAGVLPGDAVVAGGAKSAASQTSSGAHRASPPGVEALTKCTIGTARKHEHDLDHNHVEPMDRLLRAK
jgi:hypothetical protein